MGTLRTIAVLAATNFLIQGIVWSVLSILAILSYTCHFTPKDDQTGKSFTDMARLYFTDPTCWKGGALITALDLTPSSQMIAIYSLQFVFNFLLSITSLVLLFVIPRGSSFIFLLWMYKFLFIWLGTAVLDFVTTAAFYTDKDAISAGTSSISEAHGLMDMLVTVSLIAARGYLFWCINFLLMIYLLIACTMRLFKACKKLDDVKEDAGTVNGGFEIDEQGYPHYTARSRWPWLGVPLWRRQQMSPGKSNMYKDQSEQRERAGFGSREAFHNTTNIHEHLNRSYNDILSDLTPRLRQQRKWPNDSLDDPRYKQNGWQRRDTPTNENLDEVSRRYKQTGWQRRDTPTNEALDEITPRFKQNGWQRRETPPETLNDLTPRSKHSGWGRREALDDPNPRFKQNAWQSRDTLPNDSSDDIAPRFKQNFWQRAPHGQSKQEEMRDPTQSKPGQDKQRPEQFSPRPQSLHEAILTLKPLRQTRPKLSDMQTKY